MSDRVVIIGAGCTGRGFVARFFTDDAQICFVDRDASLVDTLRRAREYRIEYADRDALTIRGYDAHLPDKQGIAAIAQADLCLTAVSASNLPAVAAYLDAAWDLRAQEDRGDLRVILCENGVNVREKLIGALSPECAAYTRVAEAAVFCTTVRKPDSPLDILSESYFTLPYDCRESGFTVEVAGLIPTEDMAGLMKRKIYTYNMFSAVIAYHGYVKGYTDYAEAANDPEIMAQCDALKAIIAPVYSDAFGITLQEQNAFSDAALAKFRNRMITDTIEKNARDAARKLAENERIMGPLALLQSYGADGSILEETARYARLYMEKEEQEHG